MKKWLKYIAITIVTLFLLAYISLHLMVLSPPEIDDMSSLEYTVETIDSITTKCHNSWLHKTDGGIYELYIEGSPFEMGVTNGKLTQKLARDQEEAFIAFIKGLVPSESTLNYLKYFITLFNRNLNTYIPSDIRKEIYGVSLYAADEFDFIGDKYHRILNYHAAHDIGHTIQNMNLVNCTAFGVQGEYTKDSSLYIGRNLDFSAGDAFAKNKIVVFCKPDKGYKFAYISWGGMIGVLSGMNEHGLTISLNSAKSDIPFSAKTPVCIVSRLVLQNAKTIDEAYQIISKQETFVSESFLISSAIDNKVVVIEKSLDKTALYESHSNKLVLTNHFQSDKLKNSQLNTEAMKEGCTMYRLERTHELIDKTPKIDYFKVADILRDKLGRSDKAIGIGNEMAVNQLICHHSVVFQPSTKKMWVSKFPYQENGFLAYDLNKVFSDTFNIQNNQIDTKEFKIEPTAFYKNGGVDRLWDYRHRIEHIKQTIDASDTVELSQTYIEKTIELNPNFFYGYYIIGNYYSKISNKQRAAEFYKKALSCEIPKEVEVNMIKEAMKTNEK